MARTNHEQVTAFDAKTHLAALIRDVEQGHSYIITRRGKPVARLEPVGGHAHETTAELIEAFRAIRQRVKGTGDIRALIEQGRKY